MTMKISEREIGMQRTFGMTCIWVVFLLMFIGFEALVRNQLPVAIAATVFAYVTLLVVVVTEVATRRKARKRNKD